MVHGVPFKKAVTFKKGVFRFVVIIGAAVAVIVVANLLIAYL